MSRAPGVDGATVHPLHQALPGQLSDVSPNGHVRDVERSHQIRYPNAAVTAYRREDRLLSLRSKHPNSICQNSTEIHMRLATRVR